MKRIIAAFALVLIVMVAVAVIMKVKDTKKEKLLRTHLIGAWVVISEKVDGRDRSTPWNLTTYKQITPVAFIGLSYDKITRRISRAAGGTYTLSGNVYTEKIEYGIGSQSEVIRNSQTSFTANVDGDKWYRKGRLANGQTIEQIWERVKPLALTLGIAPSADPAARDRQPSATPSKQSQAEVISRWVSHAQLPWEEKGLVQAARYHFDQGMTLLNRRDLDGAIAAFSKAAETDPKFADAFIFRGVARWFKQDLEGALTDYGHAIEIVPNNSQAYFRRALALGQTQPEFAISDYGKAIELDPKYVGSYINRSILLQNLGDFKGAKADLDAAIALEPNNPGAYNNRGILQWETGNSREALIDMDRSIELRSNVAGMYLIRGFIKASLREFPAAFRDIDRAFQLDPNIMNGRIADPEIVDHYIERGRLLADCADLDGALVEFNKAITIGGPVEQFPSSQSGSRRRSLALALGNRGLIWLRKAKETEARKDLAKCLMIDPGTKSWLEDQILNDGLQISLNSISPSQE